VYSAFVEFPAIGRSQEIIGDSTRNPEQEKSPIYSMGGCLVDEAMDAKRSARPG
jgi:hypothetical protein